MADSEHLFKVLSKSDWDLAVDQGVFSGCGIDLQDGFIHLSGRDQVVATVNRYFAGIEGLLLVTLDPDHFEQDLKWEASREGALFPHVYGTIPTDAAQNVWPLRLDENGKHVFPNSFV